MMKTRTLFLQVTSDGEKSKIKKDNKILWEER